MTVHPFLDRLDGVVLARPGGRVHKVTRGHVEADGPACPIGTICEIDADDAGSPVLAEIVGIDRGSVILIPLENDRTVRNQAHVRPGPAGAIVPVGHGFAGRAVDALGRPIDGGPAIAATADAPLAGTVPRPLDRVTSPSALHTGIRAIDGLLTMGRGQRIGVFAASGVGKTSLVEQLAVQIECDRCVLCLVGERGREVEAIWHAVSSRPDAGRFAMVAATSDESAALRARSVGYALSLAEYWRDAGEHVLVIVDSVTRLAMALREIGLSAGEPPTVRAYTPNVFGALPRVVERCGATRSGGAISAIMTVLSETDDIDDPIVETMKSLLDGHILLSRTLAERGHFPAIDVSRSISRQATRLMTPPHAATAQAAIAMLGQYEEARIMIESGVYKPGSNAAIDRAIAGREALMAFLRQGQDEASPFEASVRKLATAVGAGGAHG